MSLKKIKLSIRDITLIGILLGCTLFLNFIDIYIPHVHALHKVFLILAIGLIGFYRSLILLVLFSALEYFIGGGKYIIIWQQFALQTIALYSFLLIVIYRNMKEKNLIYLILNIVLIFIVFLFIKVLGDSFITINNTHNFIKSFWLAIIWPGDWLDSLTSCIVTILVLCTSYKSLFMIYQDQFINKQKYYTFSK